MRSGFTLKMQTGPKKWAGSLGDHLSNSYTIQVHKQQQELREDFTYKYFIIHPSPQKMKMN